MFIRQICYGIGTIEIDEYIGFVDIHNEINENQFDSASNRTTWSQQ